MKTKKLSMSKKKLTEETEAQKTPNFNFLLLSTFQISIKFFIVSVTILGSLVLCVDLWLRIIKI